MTILAGQLATAARIMDEFPRKIRKESDEPVTSSTVLQNDNDFLWTVEANTYYSLESYLMYTGAADGGTGAGAFKVGWSLPAGGSIKWASFGVNTNGLSQYDVVMQTATPSRNMGTNGGTVMCSRLSGVVIIAGTAGTLQMQWAQGTSNATATVLKADSWMRLDKL